MLSVFGYNNSLGYVSLRDNDDLVSKHSLKGRNRWTLKMLFGIMDSIYLVNTTIFPD